MGAAVRVIAITVAGVSLRVSVVAESTILQCGWPVPAARHPGSLRRDRSLVRVGVHTLRSGAAVGRSSPGRASRVCGWLLERIADASTSIAAMSDLIPEAFRNLLSRSRHEPAILALTSACELILQDNRMPFFPAYTDHGIAHIAAVFDGAERLIPEPVREALLEPDDAAVLIGAIVLHDLAMHLGDQGFLALVSQANSHTPLPWFGTRQLQRPADMPWPELWREFQKEASRWSQSQLEREFGLENARTPPVVYSDDVANPGVWTTNDRLLIGEFIRRHHARLAHEIAIHGFPGLPGFPVLQEIAPQLADAIGVTARSHGEGLRISVAYLEQKYGGDKRPDGAALVYLMGVLRVADYFQITAERAPPMVGRLRSPQSPNSAWQWETHEPVQMSWAHADHKAVSVQVSASHSLPVHLHLVDLVETLQQELDETNAVIRETYDASALAGLELTVLRVVSNLFKADLRGRLSYVPERAQLRSAPDLFRLLVSDLYGDEPVIAGRELMQNAVDAVRARWHWEARTGSHAAGPEPSNVPGDVLVEIKETAGELATLRVADRGIGMTPTTIIESFLTAGVSFGSPRKEPDGSARWMKTGRFGIGVCAAFLLGAEISVRTRHASSARGIQFTCRFGNELIQPELERPTPRWDRDPRRNGNHGRFPRTPSAGCPRGPGFCDA